MADLVINLGTTTPNADSLYRLADFCRTINSGSLIDLEQSILEV